MPKPSTAVGTKSLTEISDLVKGAAFPLGRFIGIFRSLRIAMAVVHCALSRTKRKRFGVMYSPNVSLAFSELLWVRWYFFIGRQRYDVGPA